MYLKQKSINNCYLVCLLWMMSLISTNAQAHNLICSFHYPKVYWFDAIEKCMAEESELMCYSDRDEMMNIVKAFLSGLSIKTNVKIWLISRSCADFDENYRKDICLHLNVNIRDDGALWPFFQISCNETLPFVCCKRERAATSSSTQIITELRTTTATMPAKTTTVSTTAHKKTTRSFTTSQANTSTSIFTTTSKKTTTTLPTSQANTSIDIFTTTSKKTTTTVPTSQANTSISIFTTTPKKTTTASTTSPIPNKSTKPATTSSVGTVTAPSTTAKFLTSSSTTALTQTSSSASYPPTTSPLSSTTITYPTFCKAITRRGIVWPNTALGAEVHKPCPGNSIGEAKWTCSISGYWVSENPDMSNCQSVSVLEIKNNYSSLPTIYTIDEIDKILNNESDMYGKDLMDIVSITASLPDMLYEETASLSNEERWNVTVNSVKKTTRIIDNIVGLEEVWDDLSREDTVQTGSSILKMVDDFGILLADSLFETDTHNIFTKYIAVQVLRAPVGSGLSIPYGQGSFANLREGIVLTEGYNAQLDYSDGNLTAVFARYTGMDHVLLSSTTNEEKGKKSVLNSAVVSAVVSQGRSAVSISTEAEISVRHLVAEPNDTACVFWNLDRNDWDLTGCMLKFSNETSSVCVCNHLTNFAVLMDFQGRIDDVESIPFFYITVIGCSISIVCLLLCIIVFTCYRSGNIFNKTHRI